MPARSHAAFVRYRKSLDRAPKQNVPTAGANETALLGKELVCRVGLQS